MPILVVATGVILVVLMQCWVTGVLGDMIVFNANFATGHVKVMSKAYSEKWIRSQRFGPWNQRYH